MNFIIRNISRLINSWLGLKTISKGGVIFGLMLMMSVVEVGIAFGVLDSLKSVVAVQVVPSEAANVQDQILRAQLSIGLCVAAINMIGASLIIWLMGAFGRRISVFALKLALACEQLQTGQPTAHLDSNGVGEFEQAGVSFSKMAGVLHDRLQVLSDAEDTISGVEKLAGIGMLTAGIAHEINTPLQIITGYSNIIRRDIESDEELNFDSLNQKIWSIEHNAWRIAAIVRSLLSYVRSSTDEVQSCTLNNVVDETLLLIEHQLNTWSNIMIQKELAADLPPLACDRNQIIQVLINLLTNAADAMPTGGWITIHTAFDAEARQFCIQITDTGSGIPDHLQNKIFDPFYTTKDVGKGTGLGLSIARDIVEAHHGMIQVESQPDKGTTFTILLPQESEAVIPAEPVFLKESCSIE